MAGAVSHWSVFVYTELWLSPSGIPCKGSLVGLSPGCLLEEEESAHWSEVTVAASWGWSRFCRKRRQGNAAVPVSVSLAVPQQLRAAVPARPALRRAAAPQPTAPELRAPAARGPLAAQLLERQENISVCCNTSVTAVGHRPSCGLPGSAGTAAASSGVCGAGRPPTVTGPAAGAGAAPGNPARAPRGAGPARPRSRRRHGQRGASAVTWKRSGSALGGPAPPPREGRGRAVP